jgi:hypothetical protein
MPLNAAIAKVLFQYFEKYCLLESPIFLLLFRLFVATVFCVCALNFGPTKKIQVKRRASVSEEEAGQKARPVT